MKAEAIVKDLMAMDNRDRRAALEDLQRLDADLYLEVKDLMLSWKPKPL